MCLYTKYILNRKYLSNKKNRGVVPVCHDLRLKYVPVSCGKCIECRKRKQREWVVRLSEELRSHPEGAQFVTLTMEPEALRELKCLSEEKSNDIATKAVRRFLERVRKETGKSIRHWMITELGEKKGRIHLHGIVWADQELIKRHWKYGFVFIGTHVNEATIFYITKYMLKVNPNDKEFQGKILTSKGIGSGYMQRVNKRRNMYQEGGDTNETYTLRNGTKIALPQYYRRKLYTEEEREKLWIEKQENEYRYVMGEKVHIDNEEEYNNILGFYQEMGKRLYGDNEEEWDRQKQRNKLQRMRLARQKMRNKQK